MNIPPNLRRPYGVIPYAGYAMVWIVENVGTNSSWFSLHVQPILEPLVWPIGPIFMSGLFAQDLFTQRSWLRQWLHFVGRKFDIVAVASQRAVDEPERYEVWARIRFARNIRSGRLVLRILSGTGLGHKPFEHVFEIEKLNYALRGEVRKVAIATIGITKPGWTPFYDTWGQGIHRDHTKPSFGKGSKNIVSIELEGSLFRQRERILVVSVDGSAPYVQRESDEVFGT